MLYLRPAMAMFSYELNETHRISPWQQLLFSATQGNIVALRSVQFYYYLTSCAEEKSESERGGS